jgi:hypothetical protein
MMGNARADRVYIWDYDEDSYVEQTDPKQSFTLAQGAQVTGLVLAYSAHDESYVTIASTNHWDGPVCTIDLESRLINGFLHGPISDWYNHKIIYGNTSTLTDDLKRLPLNSFTGEPSVSNMGATYEIKVSGTGDVYGTFAQK